MKKKDLNVSFTTSNVGRTKPWTKEQQDMIDSSLPAWYEFSLVKHKDVEGRDLNLINWKKQEAERLLKTEPFKVLPDGASRLDPHGYLRVLNFSHLDESCFSEGHDCQKVYQLSE